MLIFYFFGLVGSWKRHIIDGTHSFAVSLFVSFCWVALRPSKRGLIQRRSIVLSESRHFPITKDFEDAYGYISDDELRIRAYIVFGL